MGRLRSEPERGQETRGAVYRFWVDSRPGLGLKIHRYVCLKIKKVQGCIFLTEV